MIKWIIEKLNCVIQWLEQYDVEEVIEETETKVLIADTQTPVVGDQKHIFDFRGGGWKREKYCPTCFEKLTFNNAYSETCNHCGTTEKYLLTIERVFRVIKFNGKEVHQRRYGNDKFTIGDRTWIKEISGWVEETGDLHENI